MIWLWRLADSLSSLDFGTQERRFGCKGRLLESKCKSKENWSGCRSCAVKQPQVPIGLYPTFTGSAKMRPAIPYHLDMQKYFGEHAVKAERELWIGSIILGAFACKLVYDLAKQFSPIYFGESYTKLTKLKQVEWDKMIVTTSYAIFCSLAAGYQLWISDAFHDRTPLGSLAFRSTIFSNFTIAFSTGYFFVDLAMIVWVYPKLGGPEYVLHHVLSIGSLLIANYCAQGHFYALLLIFTEVTTPFINIRWFLLTLGMKNSKIYLYNGIMLLFVWLFARVLLFVYYFYHLFRHYDQVYAPFFYNSFISALFFATMNLYWFYLIVHGAVKAVFRNKRE